jgi:hypothetical protein
MAVGFSEDKPTREKIFMIHNEVAKSSPVELKGDLGKFQRHYLSWYKVSGCDHDISEILKEFKPCAFADLRLKNGKPFTVLAYRDSVKAEQRISGYDKKNSVCIPGFSENARSQKTSWEQGWAQ